MAGRVRLRMTVAYNGAAFYGFAYNIGVPTVAGVLTDALTQVVGHPIELSCAGRTDRGVHALGQVISFDVDKERADPARLMRAVNRMCGPEIAVSNAQIVDDDFDARFSCIGRVYRYRLLNTPVGNPLLAGLCWHVEHPLDFDAMRTASEALLGTHDFSSFCRRSRPPRSMTRTVYTATWSHPDARYEEAHNKEAHNEEVHNQEATFEIKARSFCHQMVRSVVGLLVAIGSGRREADCVGQVIAARDRRGVPSPAPPHGLVLWQALY